MIRIHWQLIGIHRSDVIGVHWPSLAINDIMTLALLGFIGKFGFLVLEGGRSLFCAFLHLSLIHI